MYAMRWQNTQSRACQTKLSALQPTYSRTAMDPKTSNNPRSRWHYIEELLDILARVLDPVHDSSMEVLANTAS